MRIVDFVVRRFSICDVLVVKSLYIAFPIHKEQFALISKPVH